MQNEFNAGLRRGILLMGSASLAYMLGAHFRRLKADRKFINEMKRICYDAHFEGFMEGFAKGLESNVERSRITGTSGSTGPDNGSDRRNSPGSDPESEKSGESDFDRAPGGGIGGEIRAGIEKLETEVDFDRNGRDRAAPVFKQKGESNL